MVVAAVYVFLSARFPLVPLIDFFVVCMEVHDVPFHVDNVLDPTHIQFLASKPCITTHIKMTVGTSKLR